MLVRAQVYVVMRAVVNSHVRCRAFKCSHSLNRKCNVRFAAVSICFLSRKIVRHISGRSFVCRARAVGVAECRVRKNLHFAVTQKAIADALNHAGFLVSRIQIQRRGLRFQPSRYCYAFLTVPNEEVQAALVSHLDKKMHPALSDKALFAEPAVPRMRNWPQENSVKAELIQAPPQPEVAQPQPEVARAAELVWLDLWSYRPWSQRRLGLS